MLGGLVVILVAVAIFTAIPALRAGRLNTVDALALGRAGGSSAPSKAARAAAALRLPTVARLGVKDAFTSRSRATLTVGALALMVITLVAALSVEATYHRVIDEPALRAKPYDLRVDGRDALRAVQQDPAVERATTLTGFQVAGPQGQELQARAVGDGFAHFSYAVPDGRMFARPGEAIAGRGLYDAQHVRVGGLTPRGVLGLVNAGGAALGAIAIVIGIPAGLLVFREIMRAMSPSEGTDIVGTPGPFALALTIPFVLAVTALASSIPGRRAARASAAATLRAE